MREKKPKNNNNKNKHVHTQARTPTPVLTNKTIYTHQTAMVQLQNLTEHTLFRILWRDY